MAATMTKRQEKSRTNYNAVLDTSIVLFNKKGYKDTTIKDICEATGLSNGSVYHLFRNKDDILRHIYAVSYTHLDVYKRQVLQCLLEIWFSRHPGGCHRPHLPAESGQDSAAR